MEHDGVRRPAVAQDLDNFFKLTQYFDVIGFNRRVVTPSDVPSENQALDIVLRTIEYTDKPIQLHDTKAAEVIREIDMLSILFGISKERIKEDGAKGVAYALGNINPVSPLSIDEGQSSRLLNLSEYGIPTAISPVPTAGTTAPCTLVGTLILQNCDNLGTLVLTQLVNPGTPVLYGCIGSIANMKTGSTPLGAPETRIIEYASSQIAKFYGLPTRGDGGLTDAFSCDFQAGAEAALQFYNAVRSGINLIPGCGEIGSWMYGSLEKFILDIQVAEYVDRIVKPLEVTEENMAVDLIEKVGPRGSFMAEPHTFEHFKKEFYNPFIFSRTEYTQWEKEGKKDVQEKAHEMVQDVLQNYEKPPLDKSIERDLRKYAEHSFPVR